jgi:IS4 transposase
MFSSSHLQQILKPVQAGVFQRYVDQHQADKYCKRFHCYDLLVGLVYAQLSHSSSLRVLEGRWNQQPEQHYHLHTGALSRSTLADALERRNPAPFADLAGALMQTLQRSLRREARALLHALDSTGIILKGRGFETYAGNGSGRIDGLKLHLMINVGGQLPVEQRITSAKVSDISAGREFAIEPGITYAFDKGYCDYAWWAKIDAAGAFFVTRQKKNAAYAVVETRPASAEHILSDEVILFPRNRKRSPAYSQPLRRIVVERTGKQPLVLVSNQLQTSADEIAEQYRQRWQIELLFKWFKQHLKLKTFLGRSENAVRLQILAALIAFLLFKRYRDSSPELAAETLWISLASVSSNLFLRPLTEYARHKRRQAERAAAQLRQAGLF